MHSSYDRLALAVVVVPASSSATLVGLFSLVEKMDVSAASIEEIDEALANLVLTRIKSIDSKKHLVTIQIDQLLDARLGGSDVVSESLHRFSRVGNALRQHSNPRGD